MCVFGRRTVGTPVPVVVITFRLGVLDNASDDDVTGYRSQQTYVRAREFRLCKTSYVERGGGDGRSFIVYCVRARSQQTRAIAQRDRRTAAAVFGPARYVRGLRSPPKATLGPVQTFCNRSDCVVRTASAYVCIIRAHVVGD